MSATALLPAHLRPIYDSIAHPKAAVLSPNGNLRVTVLSSRLFRIEYDPQDTPQFEDRASQVFWFRNHPPPKFHPKADAVQFEIETDHLYLRYLVGKSLGEAESLSVHVKSCNTTWTYGDKGTGNLGGTCRTLDFTNGNVQLEQGLLSREGWVLVDDSGSLVMNENGIPVPRHAPQGARDLYFFGYGTEYSECILDFRALTGKVPLVPRYILGNWWSRYWNYSQQDIMNIISDFEKHDIPLSVFIIDMDWHIVKEEKNKTSDGWTGYTWNEELFPDYKALLNFIHTKGLRTSLNLHPASGVHPHEKQYPKFVEALGLDPSHSEPIPFDCSDPKYVKAYMELLHHPFETDGVDFWWIDWQQGTKTKVEGLDPLWQLNHLHFYDLGRDGIKRPFTFSRWAGLGSHRYPIGFSGDTMVTWKSLAYQPYFTATASNIGYGWWSHDIGGHFGGIEQPELYLRWVQFGVLSPIFRLHSSKNFFSERRPYGFDAEILRISRFALQFRHALIPYLYTGAWRDTELGVPLIRPLYHLCPKEEAAYHFPSTYAFGTELVVAPHTTPLDQFTQLSRTVIWLPPGDWYNFFTGAYFPGGRAHAIYGDLEDLPVFARAGAIVPLAGVRGWSGKSAGEIPEKLQVNVFPGEENTFEMYEDDGETTGYKKGKWWVTKFDLKNEAGKISFSVVTYGERLPEMPTKRTYELLFYGMDGTPKEISAIAHGTEIAFTSKFNAKSKLLSIILEDVETKHPIKILIDGNWAPKSVDKFEKCLTMLRKYKLKSAVKQSLYESLPKIIENPSLLLQFTATLSYSQIQALFETLLNCGLHHVQIGQINSLLVWNGHAHPDNTHTPESGKRTPHVSFALSADNLWWKEKEENRFFVENGDVPLFKVVDVTNEFRNEGWRLVVNYCGGYQCELVHKK